jgi:hypothetical protein
MGLQINIAEALKNRADYNILREPINDMLKDTQEAFEKKSPIDLLFIRGTLSGFQETYTSSIGFEHAFAETGDYGIGPIFNTEEGFSKVYTSRTFQGGFIITKQVLEDQQYSTAKSTVSKFIKRWHGDTVEYALTAISSGFGVAKTFGSQANGGISQLLLKSADTVSGDTIDPIKMPLFSALHTIVKRRGMTSAQVKAKLQSNLFYVTGGLDLEGSDAGKVAKLADVINMVITTQENYRDDNDKIAGVVGQKTIVAPNDARLKAMLTSALSMEQFNDFGQKLGPNPAYKRANLETDPYLRDLPLCFDSATQKALGFFIVDKSYNMENNGPEFTERVALTLNVEETKKPYGISYDARQRFDVNVSSWRGIAFVYIGASSPTTLVSSPDIDGGAAKTGFNAMTAITPISTIVNPVSVSGTVDIGNTDPIGVTIANTDPIDVAVDGSVTTVDGDVDLGDVITITFAANGGTGSRAAITGLLGTTIYLPNSTGLTAPASKHFGGWDTSAAATTATYAAGDALELSEDDILYAIWLDD